VDKLVIATLSLAVAVPEGAAAEGRLDDSVTLPMGFAPGIELSIFIFMDPLTARSAKT
jgi:hypothetical protein